MQNSFESYIIELSQLLIKYKVKYLIVGGTAVALYGYVRMSRLSNGLPAPKFDIDLWFEPTYENYSNLIKALEELGLNVDRLKNDKSPNPRNTYLKYETDKYTLDILPELLLHKKFNDCYSRRVNAEIDGNEINLIAFLDLISEKKESGRKKDNDDIDNLNRIQNN